MKRSPKKPKPPTPAPAAQPVAAQPTPVVAPLRRSGRVLPQGWTGRKVR